MITENFKQLLKFIDDYGEKYNMRYKYDDRYNEYFFYKNKKCYISWNGNSPCVNYLYSTLKWYNLIKTTCVLTKVN